MTLAFHTAGAYLLMCDDSVWAIDLLELDETRMCLGVYMPIRQVRICVVDLLQFSFECSSATCSKWRERPLLFVAISYSHPQTCLPYAYAQLRRCRSSVVLRPTYCSRRGTSSVLLCNH